MFGECLTIFTRRLRLHIQERPRTVALDLKAHDNTLAELAIWLEVRRIFRPRSAYLVAAILRRKSEYSLRLLVCRIFGSGYYI